MELIVELYELKLSSSSKHALEPNPLQYFSFTETLNMH
jgi:hypothetical protein